MRLFLATLFILLFIASASANDAFERVISDNKIRCGYVVNPPSVMRDPNTGEFSGITVDLMAEIGKLLNLEIEWTEEVGWATTVQGLRAGRYDVMCVGYWRNVLEAKHVFYTAPIYYSQVVPYVRADDDRFDDGLDVLNDEQFTIISTDGELASAIARRDYPKAKLKELINLTDMAQVFEEVASGKADITFRAPYIGEQYIESNPGSIKRVNLDRPLRIFQNTLGLPQHETALKSMLDTALIELQDSGVVDEILNKYDPDQQIYLRVREPYRN